MIPRPQQALTDLAMKLLFSITPETSSTYAASSVGMIAMLMQCFAQEFDRAAAVRIEDINEMTALFESMRDVPPENLVNPIAQFLRGSARESAHRASECAARARHGTVDRVARVGGDASRRRTRSRNLELFDSSR